MAGADGIGERVSRWKARSSRQDGGGGGGGAVYGIGLIGAAVWYFRSATSGREYALAAPKAVFWPAILVYRLLGHLDR